MKVCNICGKNDHHAEAKFCSMCGNMLTENDDKGKRQKDIHEALYKWQNAPITNESTREYMRVLFGPLATDNYTNELI